MKASRLFSIGTAITLLVSFSPSLAQKRTGRKNRVTNKPSTHAASVPVQPHLVGNLNNRGMADGCGCYFSFPKADNKAGRLMFFASHGGSANDAWMNIDGRDVRLMLVAETNPKGRLRVGSRFTSRYASGDIIVDMVKVVTRGGWEDVKYSAMFTVRRGGRTQVVRAVGGCGC